MTKIYRKFDPTRPVQTRSGMRARIICTDKKSDNPDYRPYPIVALVEDPKVPGVEAVHVYTDTGKYYETIDDPCPMDLVNIPVKKSGWINLYSGSQRTPCIAGTSDIYPTEEAADAGMVGGRTACVRIEWEE